MLGTLCVGVAHQSHQVIQMEIANADALPTLVNLMRNCKDPLLQVLCSVNVRHMVHNHSMSVNNLNKLTCFLQ